MHDAFEHVPILEKLPLQIDCLAAWGESGRPRRCRPGPLPFPGQPGRPVSRSRGLPRRSLWRPGVTASLGPRPLYLGRPAAERAGSAGVLLRVGLVVVASGPAVLLPSGGCPAVPAAAAATAARLVSR